LDSNCNCAGTFADADADGFCDANDSCPGGDDTIDTDGDGVADDCDFGLYDHGVICLEAECGDLGSGWTIKTDSTASNMEYITIDSGYYDPPTLADSANIVSFTFQIVEPADYVIWGHVKAPLPNEDSFWVKVDNGNWIRWNGIPNSNTFMWDDVHDSDNNYQTLYMYLSLGTHTLQIAYRESGACLDKICLQHDHDPAPINYGQLSINCDTTNLPPTCLVGTACDDGNPCTEGDTYMMVFVISATNVQALMIQ